MLIRDIIPELNVREVRIRQGIIEAYLGHNHREQLLYLKTAPLHVSRKI